MPLVLALTGLRLLLGPLLLWMASRGIAGLPAVLLCLAALASDYFDGAAARRYGVDTPAVRRFDSATDTAFFLCAACAAWLLYGDLLRPWLWLAGGVAALEIGRYAFDLAKFRREAAYHAWSAKAWGLSLFAALVVLLGFGSAVPLVPFALALGIVADAEGLAISVILPVWTHDVKSIAQARRIRAAYRAVA